MSGARLGLALAAAALAGAAAGGDLGAPPDQRADAAYQAALAWLYDGAPDRALAALAQARREHGSEDPVGAYLEALVVAWQLEQRRDTALDRELLRRTALARAQADVRLAVDPADGRARFARGAAWGVESRYHLFRLHRSDAAKTAARMREDLRLARRTLPDSKDVRFGLGLYDYYADVLPGVVKVLRFFAGIPGGDRALGLAEIEAARDGSLFHGSEARAQLYEIYAFYERKPDHALGEIRELRRRHPGWPLWGLKLAEHLRERLGLYAESAQVARELLGERAEPPQYGAAAHALARLALGEALLEDLRLPEARRELLAIKDGVAGVPELAARARLLLGRSLELEGDRDAALVHYRIAAAGPDKELRKRAQRLLGSPLPEREVLGWQLIALARRQREDGHTLDAAASYRRARAALPSSREAALFVAEHEVLHGRPDDARRDVTQLAGEKQPAPPFVHPWSQLLLAQLHDLRGERASALHLYQEVVDEPYGRSELREKARQGLRRPFTRADARAASPSS